MFTRLLAALGVLAVCAPPLLGQSLLARQGLGYTIEPVDARARALGGVGLGLPGLNLSLINPAGVAGVPAPALLVGFQYDESEASFGGVTAEGQSPRFPVVHAALPLGERWVLSAGYGGFLDQSWATQVEDTLADLRGRRTAVRDRFASVGGIARFRAGAARTIGERFAVGLAADVYTGVVRDSVTRFFSDTTGVLLAPSVSLAERSYNGVGLAAGIRWIPSAALNVAAAVSAGGELDADGAGDQSYQLPITASLGASGRIAQRTIVATSVGWTGWGATASDFLQAGEVRDSWSVGGGVEHELRGRAERVFPVRLGARYAALPFGALGGGSANEWAVSAGVGARLGGGAAQIDFAGERGSRDASGTTAFEEGFWRFSASLTVLGR